MAWLSSRCYLKAHELHVKLGISIGLAHRLTAGLAALYGSVIGGVEDKMKAVPVSAEILGH